MTCLFSSGNNTSFSFGKDWRDARGRLMMPTTFYSGFRITRIDVVYLEDILQCISCPKLSNKNITKEEGRDDDVGLFLPFDKQEKHFATDPSAGSPRNREHFPINNFWQNAIQNTNFINGNRRRCLLVLLCAKKQVFLLLLYLAHM